MFAEGVICNDNFWPLTTPVLRTTEEPVTRLNCLNRFSVEEETLLGYDILQGITIVTYNDTVSTFPLLWSRIDNEAVLEWVTTPEHPERDGVRMITVPLGPCSVKTELLRLPSIKYRGNAVVFYASEADSRDCGMFRSNGHAAAAIIPLGVPEQLERAEALRYLFGHSTPLRGFAGNPIFAAHGVQFHHIRAIVIEWGALARLLATASEENSKAAATDGSSETVDTQFAYVNKFLATLFEMGIIMVVGTFRRDIFAYTGPPRSLVIEGLEVLTSPGLPLPSSEYQEILEAIPTRYSVRSLTEGGTSRWYDLTPRLSEVEQNHSLISAVVDGMYPTQEPFKPQFPIEFVMKHWLPLAERHPFLPKPARFPPIEEYEILMIATKAASQTDCDSCTIVNATNGIEATQLQYIPRRQKRNV